MKILYFITRSDEIGGAHIHVRDLAVRYQTLGHEVAVVVGGKGFYLDHLRDNGLKVYSLPYLRRSLNIFRDIYSLFSLLRIVRVFNPDIISSHSAKAGILARSLSFFCSSPVIFTAHGWSFADGISFPRRQIYLLIEKFFAHFADRIICVCQSDIDLALRYRVAPPNHFCLVYNGMPDLSQDVSSVFKSSESSDRVNILCTARFEAQKDHSSLLLCLKKLEELNWHLLLVGDGSGRSSVEDFVDALNLASKVSFLGRISSREVAMLCSQSDIFVLPSFWEGFPRSILEAMRSSLPVVATNVGGVSESVIHNENGFLVQPSDIESWQHYLGILIRDQDLRIRFGRKSRVLFEENFLFDRMASNTLSLYTTLLES